MRYILKISYDGKNYAGFQKQKDALTIQDCLEKVISNVLRYDVNIVSSGRTDAGVSAIEQTCHFDVDDEIDIKGFVGYANHLLPNDIKILSVNSCEENFHARYSAKKKTYEYYFYVSKQNIPYYDKFASIVKYDVDIVKMKMACEYFIGEYDFSSFCAGNTSVVNKVRTIYNMCIKDVGDNMYKLEVTGNGFLYNMVRIIMGTLLEVGKRKISPSDITNIILSKDRKKAGKTVVPKGLVLKKVIY